MSLFKQIKSHYLLVLSKRNTISIIPSKCLLAKNLNTFSRQESCHSSLYRLRSLVHTLANRFIHKIKEIQTNKMQQKQIRFVGVGGRGGIFSSPSPIFFSHPLLLPLRESSRMHTHMHKQSAATTLFTGGPSFSHPPGGLGGAQRGSSSTCRRRHYIWLASARCLATPCKH